MKRTAFCVPDWTAHHSGGNVYNRKIWEHLHSLFPDDYFLHHSPSSLDASYDVVLLDSLFLGRPKLMFGDQRRFLLVHMLKQMRPDLYDRKERSEEYHLLKPYDGYICTGESIFDIMREWYPAERLKLLEPGLGDIEIPEIKSPLSNGPLEIVLASNLVQEKDILPFLLELERQVEGGRFPIGHTQITLFGADDLQSDYADQCLDILRRIRSSGLNFIYRRPIARTNYLNKLNQADLFIHPAKREAFGMAVVEAVRAGLPVLLLEGANTAHSVFHGKNGLICRDMPNLIRSFIALIGSNIEHEPWPFSTVQQLKFTNWIDQAVQLHRFIQGNSFES